MFSYCTGGPFGLEDMVTTSGPGMSLIFLLVIPFFWCIPVSLVSAELTTAMPVEGGFYRWVRAGFGDFWGFLAGWWNWCASFLLGSVYAVQFADYLGYYFPEITGWRHYIVSLAIVARDHLHQRARHSDGGEIRHRAGTIHPASGAGVGRDRTGQMASQSIRSGDPSASAGVPRFRRGAGAGTVAVFRIRAVFDGRRRSGQSEAQLSAGTGAGGAHVYRGLLPAYPGFARGTRQLAELAYRILSPPRRNSSEAAGSAPGCSHAAMVTQVALLNGTILASTRMPFAMAEDGYLPTC